MARKILLADDSVTAQNMGRKILADAGYEVITVNNGSAALKKIAEHKPELIILDVYMPGYSGLEVCQRLKEAQETSRVPVLLTVGKLEPFKPEEAKRVRADAFIVKPFEASELLSALAKLEDKIVPRAEPSKPGRSSRGMATVEASSPTSRSEAGDDVGWKNRIAFPAKKKDSSEESPDDAALYNLVNRDLRTVVQRAEPDRHSAPVAEGGQDHAQTSKTGDEQAGLGALADITTEEIAALAAAAAQVHAKRAETEIAPSEAGVEAAKAGENIASPDEANGVAPEPEAVVAQGIQENPLAEISPGPAEVMTATARPDQEQLDKEPEQHPEPEHSWNANSGNGVGQSSEPEDLPVTMAVSAISQDAVGSRWTAVSVAVDPQEAAISLEQEMQQALRAFASAAAVHAGPATLAAETQLSGISLPAPEAVTESLQALASVGETQSETPSETKLETKPEQALPAAAEVSAEAAGAPVAEFQVPPGPDAGASSEIPQQPESFTSAQEYLPEPRTSPTTESVTSEATPGNAEYVDGVSAEAVAQKEENSAGADLPVTAPTLEAAPGDGAYANEPTVQLSPAVAEAPAIDSELAAGNVPDASPDYVAADAVAADAIAPDAIPADHVAPDHIAPDHIAQHKESELTATTAAAWASWRQIRESGPVAKSQNATSQSESDTPSLANPEHAPEHTEEPAPAVAVAAMAVAAGAEASPQELAPSAQAPSPIDPYSVASIVDNLLAELRPRIVEEISRKLAADKK